MQCEESLKQQENVLDVLVGVMSIVSFTVGMFSLFGNFTPAAHFVLGLLMMTTAILCAVLATYRTVLGHKGSGFGSVGMVWFMMGCWLVGMADQFAAATFRG